MNAVQHYGTGSRDFGTVRGLRISPRTQLDIVELTRTRSGSALPALRKSLSTTTLHSYQPTPHVAAWFTHNPRLPTNPLATAAIHALQILDGDTTENPRESLHGSVVLLGTHGHDLATLSSKIGLWLLNNEFMGLSEEGVRALRDNIPRYPPRPRHGGLHPR